MKIQFDLNLLKYFCHIFLIYFRLFAKSVSSLVYFLKWKKMSLGNTDVLCLIFVSLFMEDSTQNISISCTVAWGRRINV